MSIPALLPHLFRQESARMTAVLSRHFGLPHLETAEDIVSDTFLKALEHWPVHGIPDNPSAWLYTVAGNKARDLFRRQQHFQEQVKREVIAADDDRIGFSEEIISDSQLAMIFAVCNPAINEEAQICLALQILCGFSVEEIADAFLAKTETIRKRLQRARAILRQDRFEIACPPEPEILARLGTVLRTLYLLFNEGYFSQSENQFIRKDLCAEAMRLCHLLSENRYTPLSQIHALLALMCFQSSRLDARTDAAGRAVRFEEQDKRLWNEFLIEKGNEYLLVSMQTGEASKYHFEASIAYWHTTEADDRWQHILRLYDRLLLIESSPVASLNRLFAFSKLYGDERAVAEACRLNLPQTGEYHALMGYFQRDIDVDAAIAHYRQACTLSKSPAERQVLQREIDRLSTQD